MLRTPRLGLVALVSLASACSSATVPDGGTAPDAAPRADALPNADALVPDTGPPADTGVEADAGSPDAADDAGFADAAAPDATPIDPCGPVDRAQGPARLNAAVAAWIGRCNPELTPREAEVAGQFATALALPAFEDVNLTYDATSAGACGCAIEAAPCDMLAWLRAVPACDATLVATTTTGDTCSNDFQCPTRHRCSDEPPPSAVSFGGGLPLECRPGTCRPIVSLGARCLAEVDCEPGTYCNFGLQDPVCEAKARLTEDCSERPCVGDYEDVLLLPPNTCVFAKAGATCQPRGRAGDACDRGSCHDLYNCGNNYTCEPIPGDGDACPTTYDVPTPGFDEQLALISEAQFTCRVPTRIADNRGFYCTQTGTTTGVARCLSLPDAGEACGIGQGLAPACSSGSYCAGVDWNSLAPISALCVPQRTETSTCTDAGPEIASPCEAGTRCFAPSKSNDYTCTNICDLFGGGGGGT